MTVAEQPVVNLCTFQVWDADLGAWRDLAQRATQIDIRRGGQQSGAATTMQVGTLSATLFGALDLSQDAALRPNSPIRVVRPQLAPARVWEALPTGNVSASTAGIFPRSVEVTTSAGAGTVGYGANLFNNPPGFQVGVTPSTSTTIAKGTILAASPNEYPGAIDSRPIGAFNGGSAYTIRTSLQLMQGAPSRGYRIVLYRGPSASPQVIAQSDRIVPPAYVGGARGTAVQWAFVAPADDDWKLGIAIDDTVTVASGAMLYGLVVWGFEVWDTGRERPEFTGTIADINQTVDYDKAANVKQVFTSVQAVDAIQSLANTDRYGVVANSGAGYQSWGDRIQQLSESALVQIDAPTEGDTPIYDQAAKLYAAGWDSSGTIAAGNGAWYYGQDGQGGYNVYRINGSTAATTMTSVRNVQRVRTFDPTASYAAVLTVTVTKTSGVTQGQWAVGYSNGSTTVYGDSIDMTSTAPQTVTVRFQPTSAIGEAGVYQKTGATLAAGAGTAFSFTITNMRILRVATTDAYALQDVAYESSLLNHFDMACNSVGARWYVTKRNTVLFRRRLEDTAPVLTFADTDAGDVSYIDVALSFDTRNVVNGLKLNQHGYDPATGNTDDYSTTITADSSIARWGARASEMDTCLYTGPGHEGDLERRGLEAMSPLRRPSYGVTSFSINVQSNPDVLDALELRATIAVLYEQLKQTCRVLAITHAITPTRWIVTVDLSDVKAGATFADLTEAFSGTFAQFDALHAGQTFRQFNADPI